MDNVLFLRIRRVVMTGLRGIAAVLLCLSVTVTLITAFVKLTVFDRNEYQAVVEEDGFSAKMATFVRDALESECLFYDLPFTVLDTAVTEEFVHTFSLAYADSLYEALFVGGELTIPEVDPEPYRAAIAAHFETLPKEAQPLDVDADETIAAELAKTASLVLQSGVSDRILQPAHAVINHPLLICLMSNFNVLAGMMVALLILCLLLGVGCIRRQVYAACSALTVGSMLVFVPAWLLQRYDLPAKLVLGASPLRLYVEGILYRFTQQLYQLSAWALVLSAVLLLAAIVWRVWPRKLREV